MTKADPQDGAFRLHLRVGSRATTVTVSKARMDRIRAVARTILREPFQRRTWAELAFFLISGFVACVGMAFILATMATGVFLVVVFVGLLVIAASLRGARGIGSWHRALALQFLDEHIAEPDPFLARPGFRGWLKTSLTYRAGWRAVAYAVVKMPLLGLGVWFALSVWIDAVLCLSYPLSGANEGVSGFGPFRNGLGLFSVRPGSSPDAVYPELIFVYGFLLLFAAPWAMRLVIYLDRRLMRLLLGPDAMTVRVRSLEQSRAQTVDASAAMLRRIERDLHDGTQAQLVALAMRLGQAKEQLADEGEVDLDQVRLLIGQAHSGAKEAIVELRDLARGIHPPVLDTGLESALATLTARAAIPTDLSASVQSRPTPAIETIGYFCVAELLANVAQHAQASRATVTCVQHGAWLRIAVRDDGRGGAVLTRVGSSSSGLAGLTDRVRAVDGHLNVVSPAGGPTVVTVDLPCHA